MTSNRRLSALLGVLAIIAIPAGKTFAASCKDTPLGNKPEAAAELSAACTDTAVNEPSKFAWLLLAKICPLDSTTDGQPCEWQSWATINQTFPVRPEKDAPPEWPADGKWPVDRDAKFEYSCRKDLLVADNVLERRRNQPEFEYIVKSGLWYQEGLARAYRDDQVVAGPSNAVAVAVTWKEIRPEEKNRYHWKILPDGKTICGLTNIDVKSKILPKWFFFSFEHVDNPGRCDFTGCRDDFGEKPAFTPPIYTALTARYAPTKIYDRPIYQPGSLTEKLESLIALNAKWKNYRLKGVQTEFATPDGKPTILAGSQIEGVVFPASSSCITCHSQAGFDSKGHTLRGRGAVGELELSPNGVPDPAWFYDMGPDGWQLRYKQSDYLWVIPTNACPLDCPPCDSEHVPSRCNCGC